MLATLAEKPFSGKDWLFEVKYDGVRVLAHRHRDAIELYGRSGQQITARYPELVKALRALLVEDCLIDGEIVALDDHGKPSFQRLQARMGLTALAISSGPYPPSRWSRSFSTASRWTGTTCGGSRSWIERIA
jgi:bifunctional non-homologous end joining protein LigD